MPRATVKQDRNGVWTCRPYLGRTPEGVAIRPQRRFPEAKTEAEAQALAQAWLDEISAQDGTASTRLSDLLAEYIDTCEANGASPNSIRQYRLYARSYCGRFLAGRDAAELTAYDLTQFEKALLRRGGKGGRPLSASTVTACCQFLRGAYGYFVRSGIVSTNPVLAAEKPKREVYEALALDEADFQTLAQYLEAQLAKTSIIAPCVDKAEQREIVRAFGFWLALHTGMRVGEVAGVRRRDRSQRRGFVHVGGTVVDSPQRGAWRKEKPKGSGKGRRNISLTADEFEVISAFERWQDENFDWCSNDSPLVSMTGDYMRPDDLSKAFSALRNRLGLDSRATFHTLRHTHASWCLAEGVDLITLSERLGHSSPDITARIYAHVISGRDMGAAEAFSALAKSMRG